MRTSRASRDTARLVTALASRRSLRSSELGSAARKSEDDIPETTLQKEDLASDSDSPLSPPPSDFEDAPNILHTPKSVTPKRNKRSAAALDPVSPKSVNTLTPGKRTKRAPAKRVAVKHAEDAAPFSPPPDWEEVYNLTAQMRSQWLAPVDTMGCESLAEDTREPRDRRFQTLVALMLSSQTKDTVTAVAMKNLQDNLPGGFTLESILVVTPELLNELIAKVGFHNNKTKFIKQTAEILRDKFASDIPDTIDGMVSLPGVGPKMAYLCMSAAWGRDEGIGVDVHVHRITNLWGWHKTKTPEETRKILEAWLPKEKWHDINHLLVGFGQTWCPPAGRKCGDCMLGQQKLCPSAVMEVKSVKRVKKEVKKEEDGDSVGVAVPKNEEEVIVKEEPVNEGVDQPVPFPANLQDIEDIGR